jgi:hypothetical protein
VLMQDNDFGYLRELCARSELFIDTNNHYSFPVQQ